MRRGSVIYGRVLGVLLVVGIGRLVSVAVPAANAVDRPSPVDLTCTRCHAIDAAFSHPVGIAPTRTLPAQFPLDRGRVTCVTCHDQARFADHLANPRRSDGMLREPGIGAEFCIQCHDPGSREKGQAHGAGTGRAHLKWASNVTRIGYVSTVGGLDGESRACLECHDGTFASDVGAHVAGSRNLRSHPVGVPYKISKVDRLGRPLGDMDLVPKMMLDPKIRLFDDTVGCGSCHSPYAGSTHLLVKSNNYSSLCLSCHKG